MISSPPVTEQGHLRCCTVCHATFRTDFERCPLDGGPVIVSDVDPLIGATVGGHYEIEALIGVGAMGRVYRAHHTRLVNKRYALKVLFGELTASPAMRMRFAHEAESASKLDHPNIIGVLDFGCTESGLMYLVMDLVEGPTLGGLIDQGAMSATRVIAIARQLCAGLVHAHARGIVHRDFKPDNILVSASSGTETLRIADFGLAISLSDGDEDDARLTGTGILCTPTYAAPEQLLGKEIDHRADLYALGVTMYEMLTGGVLPFARGSQEVMLWKVTTEWPAVSTRAPKAPRALAELLRRLLAREPSARPTTAQDTLDTLDRLVSDPGRVAPQPTVRWRRLLLFAVPVALVVGLGIEGVARLVRTKPTPARSEAVALAPIAGSEEMIHSGVIPSVTRESAAPAPAPLTERAPEHRPQRRLSREAVPPTTPVVLASEPVTPQIAPVLPVEPVPAPAVTQPATPPPPAAPTPDVPPPVAAPVPPPRLQPARVARPPVVLAPARPPRIVALEISGALASSVVGRAHAPLLPARLACPPHVGGGVVAVRYAIEETRRAVNVQIDGAGASCVAATLGTMRTAAAPDVGEVTVMVRLAFGSGT